MRGQARDSWIRSVCLVRRGTGKTEKKIVIFFVIDFEGWVTEQPRREGTSLLHLTDPPGNSQWEFSCLPTLRHSQWLKAKKPLSFQEVSLLHFFMPAHIKTPQIRNILSADKLESIQRRARRNELWVLEGLTRKERLEELNMSSLAERWLSRREVINVYKYLKGVYTEEAERFCSVSHTRWWD